MELVSWLVGQLVSYPQDRNYKKICILICDNKEKKKKNKHIFILSWPSVFSRTNVNSRSIHSDKCIQKNIKGTTFTLPVGSKLGVSGRQLSVFKSLSSTIAPLYYTYKILKYTVKISHDCSYMFRSIWTIIREPMPNLAKVTILWRYSVKICRQMFGNVGKKCFKPWCVLCAVHGIQYTPQLETLFTNIAEHLTTYFY